jgi:hypothetical protein
VKVAISEDYDSARQIDRLRLYYQLPERSEEVVVEVCNRIYFPRELDALLQYDGFRLEAKFGNYERTASASDSPIQLVFCRASQ